MADTKGSDSALARLQSEYRQLTFMAYAMIGMVALVIVVSAFRRFALTLVILLAVVLFQILVFRKKQKQYTAHIVEENLKQTVCPLLHTDTVEKKGCALLQAKDILETGIFPVIDKPGTINLFTTVYGFTGAKGKTVPAACSDVTLAVPQEGARVSADILCGSWIRASLPGDCTYSLEIRKGRVSKSDPDERVPARFLQMTKELSRFSPGEIYICLHDRTADFFIKDRFLDSGFSPRTRVTQQLLDRNPLPELEKVLDLIWILVQKQ